MNTNDQVQQYTEVQSKFVRLTQKLDGLVKELMKAQNIRANVESRTKEVSSFFNKLNRPGKAYSDPIKQVTDLSGIRIILFSISDIEKVSNLLRNEFNVDQANSTNKMDLLEPDRFGYLSEHFVVQLGDSRKNLPEWVDLGDLKAEIQVRTILQHSWAAVEHLLVYKNTHDVPNKLKRRLSRLSALFELADDELDAIIRDVSLQKEQYRDEVATGDLEIEVNVDSLKAYIQGSSKFKYWEKFTRENIGIGIDNNDWGDLSRDVKFSQYFDIKSIKALDELLSNARGWGEIFFENYYKKDVLIRLNTTPDKVSLVFNGPITLLMIASNAEKISADILKNEFGWDKGQMLLDIAKWAKIEK